MYTDGFTDLRLWDDQFNFFGKYFKVIRYDIRGFGKSGKPSEPFSHSEDLKGLFDFLGIRKAHLIGMSMDGSIAIDFTLKYPDLVECLILSGPSLRGYNPTIDEASKHRSLAGISVAKRDANFIRSVEFMLDDPMWRQSNLKARQRLKEMFMDTSLGSEDSQPIKEIAGVLNSNISMIHKVEINGTRHLPNLDKPDEFNKIILNFCYGQNLNN